MADTNELNQPRLARRRAVGRVCVSRAALLRLLAGRAGLQRVTLRRYSAEDVAQFLEEDRLDEGDRVWAERLAANTDRAEA